MDKEYDMKTYIVKSYHTIFVDDYNEGEGKEIGGYPLKDEVQADNPKDAVTRYLRDNLGYNLDFNNCEVSLDDKNLVQTSCLVDGDHMQPSNNEFELWKKGEVELYSNHIELFVYEINEVSF